MNYNIINFDELPSTNTYAKENISSLKDHDVIVCDLQTGGRGRMNRSFFATRDSLTFSIVFKDQFILDNFSSLSLISAVAVFKTIQPFISKVDLKWPNDLLVNNKKICGILLEGISTNRLDSLILGIGININNEFFPEELNATSLYLESQRHFDKHQILNSICDEINKMLNDLKNDDRSYLKIFKENNYLLNKEVYATIGDEKKKVKVIDIQDDNSILVKADDQVLSLNTGEITFHKNY